MKVDSNSQSDTKQADLQKSQRDQEMQVQRQQAQQIQEDQKRAEELAKMTGMGQNLDIKS